MKPTDAPGPKPTRAAALLLAGVLSLPFAALALVEAALAVMRAFG